MRKYSVYARKVHRSIRLVVTLFFLLGFLVQNVAGSIYCSLLMEPNTTVTSPPVILQAGTVGSGTIYTNGTSAKVSVAAPAPVPTYYPNGYSVLSGNWWNLSYGYRKKITVVNNVASTLSSGYSVYVSENTASLISAGKMLSSGNDLRIVYWNATPSSWVELDRDVIDINTTSTQVWFKTQADISASGSDDNYYIYYGNPSAGSPPANKNDVYLIWDDFLGASLDASKWMSATGSGGSVSVSGSVVSVDMGNVISQDNSFTDIVMESKSRGVAAEASFFLRSTGQTYDQFSSSYGFHNWYTSSDWAFTIALNNTQQAWDSSKPITTGTWYIHKVIIFGYTIKIYRYDLNYNLLAGPVTWTDGASTYASGYVGFRVDGGGSGDRVGEYDWVKIRKYVEPEPSISAGSEEPSYYVSGTVPASVQDVDSDYLIIRSVGTGTTASTYYPSGYALGGSTNKTSGGLSNLTLNDGVNMTFRSYYSGNTTIQPIVNMNFTSVATGWAYGEANDVNNFASGAWSSTGGNGDQGCYDLMVDDTLAGETFDIEQWVNYTFTVDAIPLQAIIYVSYRYTSDDDATGTPKIKLVRPDGSLVDVWIGGTVTLSAGSDTGHTYVSVDATSNFTLTGTYQLSLYTHTDSLKAADKATVHNYWDDAGITLTDPIYTAEVEFTGSSNTYTWTELNLTVDSSWTIDSVDVTIQVYDSTAGQYPTSGEGYLAYTSGTANTDETKILRITTTPHHFRNATGNWKIKVNGTKTTDTQFDFKADWTEYKPTHYSEYTVSTEFIFSGMTRNTPTQLNFTVVTQYNTSSVNVTIQVWNYSSSAYATSGEGYSTYTSSGSNETTDLSINTNPQLYTSGGNAKIKVTGVLTTNSTYQQETNQIKLVYKYDASSTYDYVLVVTEQDAVDWRVNLTVYGSSDITRLSGTTVSFYDGTTSDQIVASGGIITQSEGPAYNLNSSSTIKIKMSNVDATSSGISYLYVYLKILVPDTSTYALYIITFEIT